jgi:hypothetical protein
MKRLIAKDAKKSAISKPNISKPKNKKPNVQKVQDKAGGKVAKAGNKVAKAGDKAGDAKPGAKDGDKVAKAGGKVAKPKAHISHVSHVSRGQPRIPRQSEDDEAGLAEAQHEMDVKSHLEAVIPHLQAILFASQNGLGRPNVPAPPSTKKVHECLRAAAYFHSFAGGKLSNCEPQWIRESNGELVLKKIKMCTHPSGARYPKWVKA